MTPLYPKPDSPYAAIKAERENLARLAEDDGPIRPQYSTSGILVGDPFPTPMPSVINVTTGTAGNHPTPAHAELAKLVDKAHQEVSQAKRRYEALVAARSALIAAWDAR